MECLNKKNWNKFILENNGSFLQSWEWGEFQASVGRRVFRFAADKWQSQFIEMPLPFGKKYWHCPRGPVIANSEWPIANSKIQEIIEKVKKSVGKDVIFFRLGPEWEIANSEGQIANGELTSPQPSLSKGEGEIFTKVGFKQLPYDIEPSQTLILDITKTENELLAQMHEKWRYNIQLAKRKGVQVKLLTSDVNSLEQYFEDFYRLMSEGTSERKHIKHHPKEYYRKQLEIGLDKPSTSSGNNQGPKFLLFIAEFEEKVIAANIVVIFGDKTTYLHGATDNNARSLMAPHLLQWEQIEYAKSLGCTKYDFWGIVNEHTLDKRGQSWEGFTHFKKGFGGHGVNYVGYFDYPLNKSWYFLYRLVQKFRR